MRSSFPGLRVAEYLLLFVALPLTYRYLSPPIPLIPSLWLLAAGCLLALWNAPDFDRVRLWNATGLGMHFSLILGPFLLATPLLVGATAWFEPDRLFAFVRNRPVTWAIVMVLYPVLSAYPQGVVYRAFIGHRYSTIFRRPWSRILASAAAFSLVHVVFGNWIAPSLSFAGGILFAWTYERTRSSLVATLQHALLGCLLFTTGLGWYFYYG